MRKITLFRTLSIIIVVFNILNFFFMAASYTGINVKESATISDYAFYNYSNIDGMYHVIGSASDNRLIPAIVILFVDIYLLFVLLFRTTKASDYLSMPYKRIFITCAIGIFLHIFLLQFSVPSSSFDESYFDIIWKGMLLNTLWTIGYIVIIVFFARIKKKNITCNVMVKTKLRVKDVIVISILAELFLSFFYVSLVNRYEASAVVDGVKHTTIYGKLFFSQFMMMFKQTNYYDLEGKVEGYAYMIIPLILIFAQIIIAIIKPKGKAIMISVLSIICIIVMTIGLADMCDSIYTNYISKDSRNFFQLVGVGYYFIIALNIAILGVYLYPLEEGDIVIIDVNEIEKIVNYETIKNSNTDNETNESNEIIYNVNLENTSN